MVLTLFKFKIYDGATIDDPLMGTHCGSNLPSSYKSTGNQMLIVMRSDNATTSKGFKATVNKGCGARIVVTDQGFLDTSASTDNQLNCSWILVAQNPGRQNVEDIFC